MSILNIKTKTFYRIVFTIYLKRNIKMIFIVSFSLILSCFFLLSQIAFLLASVGCFDLEEIGLTNISTHIELVIITSRLFNAFVCNAHSLNSLVSSARETL